MASNPVTFNGSSSYSSSFQQVLTRSVNIASLPLTLMQNNLSDLQNQQGSLSVLQANFASLNSAIQNVNSAAIAAPSASVSNSSILTASADATAATGTYTLEVDDLGSSSSWLSKAGATPVTDVNAGNISSATSFTLSINGHDTTITPTGASLQSLADAINNAGAGVQATIVNVGTSSAADYRLGLTSTNLAADTITLNDGADLTSTSTTGSAVQYQINGTTVNGNSRQITLAPGLTVNLLQKAVGQPVSVNVTQSTNSLANALNSFANSYNASVDMLAQQHGQSAGYLQGSGVVFSLQESLRQMNQFSGGSGNVKSLATLGLELDSTGHFTFSSAIFNSASAADIQSFLGSTTTDGFLKTANDVLASSADPTNGMLQGSINSIKSQITRANDLISDEQNRISDLTTALQSQLTAADASIAVLEQQKTFFTSLFAAQYLTNNLTGNSVGG